MRNQIWSTDKLRDYINFVSRVFEPGMSDEAEILIKNYY